MMDYSDVRYLLAKKSVDDRALNQTVLSALRTGLATLIPGASGRRLNVLEIGAGVGTMVSRLSDWDVIRDADYTLVDQDRASLEAAKAQLREWAGRDALITDDKLHLGGPDRELRVRLQHCNILEHVVAPENRQRYDVVLANAVLDLLDLRPALQRIWNACKPGALFWFTVNFDGETIFLPELELDEQVMRLYHRTMDERVRDGQPAGDSKTGRRLLTLLPEIGAALESAGSSDWVVFPGKQGYGGDEAYFLHHIVHTIDTALQTFPDLDRPLFDAWVRARHEQIERSQLCYIAHQLDVLGRAPG
jgi:SAM-dependent methyltransferase